MHTIRLRSRGARCFYATCVVTALVGCDKRVPASRQDSVATAGSPASGTKDSMSRQPLWLAEIGPALLVEGGAPDEAILLGPRQGDSLVSDIQTFAASGATISLLGRGGAQLTARLTETATRSGAECTSWSLRDLKPDGVGWSLGFARSGMKPVPMDSVEVLSARDSMTLVAEVSRLASAVTAQTDPAFQGLRFTVHDIRRFEAAPGVQSLVAHVIRRVNQEANPQEEQSLIIAERDSGVISGPYRLTYAERNWGLEDQVTTPEVVGGFFLARRAALVIARDNESGVSYSILQRQDGQRWLVRWNSQPTACS